MRNGFVEEKLRSVKGEQPEAYLIRRAKSRSIEAFTNLFQIYLNGIYRYIYFRVFDEKTAQDITEQVFLDAWETLPVYRDWGRPFSAWLYHIAHGRLAGLPHDAQENDKSNVEPPNPQSDDRYNRLKQIIRSQDTEVLAKAIKQLPDIQQQMIVLRFIEGLSLGEVARLLAKSPGACRKLQYRALAALHLLLGNM